MEARGPSGWEGRIAAIDPEAERATLEAGGLRVTVPLADLVAVTSGDRAARPVRRPLAGRRGELEPPVVPRAGTGATPGTRAATAAVAAPRSVAATLDLRGARVDEALELLDRYLDQAAVAQAGRVTIVHGHGSGALRDAVRDVLSSHPLVREWRPGERGEGGDGASVVSF
jgi:DNA mismatch repair protein MutS2